jgi:hypothetical protein
MEEGWEVVGKKGTATKRDAGYSALTGEGNEEGGGGTAGGTRGRVLHRMPCKGGILFKIKRQV